jgi:hypothetical protein
VIFDGKILSKQAEIPSSCRKGQGQHMGKKSGKKLAFFWQCFLEVSVFTALTVCETGILLLASSRYRTRGVIST